MTAAIRPAPLQLAELACAMREDWDRADVTGAIHAAGMARTPDEDLGRAFHRIALELVRVAGDPDGRPRAVADAARNPLGRGVKLPTEQTAALAGEARQMLQDRLDEVAVSVQATEPAGGAV